MKNELNFINEYFKINDPYSKNPYCILNLPSGKTFTYSMGVRKTTFSKIILDYEVHLYNYRRDGTKVLR